MNPGDENNVEGIYSLLCARGCCALSEHLPPSETLISFARTQVIHGCPEPVGSVCVPEISLRTYSVKRFANRFLHIPTRLDWKSTEFRRNFPLSFRLESVGKEMVGIRRNRQESTKNASDPTQLLTDPAIGMLDLGI